MAKDLHNVEVNFAVADKVHHWLYFGVPRSEEEARNHPIRKTMSHLPSKMGKITVKDGRHHLGEGTNGESGGAGDLDTMGFQLVRQVTSLSTQDFLRLRDMPQECLFSEEANEMNEKKEESDPTTTTMNPGDTSRSKTNDGEDDDDVLLRKKFYEEVETFLEKQLGATAVGVYQHIVRSPASDSDLERVFTADGRVIGYAAGAPHNDTSPLTADETYRCMSAAHPRLKPHKGKGRYLHLNFWRNISEDPIEDNHLAVLDDRTVVKPDSYVARDLFLPRKGHAIQYGLNYRHKDVYEWYYFPQMRKDEALLFKQADSDTTKPARGCFHMSVSDPAWSTKNGEKDYYEDQAGVSSPPTTQKTRPLPRQSIEVRCIAIFADSPCTVPTDDNFSPEMMNHNEGLPSSIGKDSDSKGNLTGGGGLNLTTLPILGPFFSLLGKLPLFGSFIDAPKEEVGGDPQEVFLKEFKEKIG